MSKITGLHRIITFNGDVIDQESPNSKSWLNTSRPLTAEDLQGRIILLDFWTFCCINCIHVIPDLQYLEHEFGEDLTVIGVHSAKFTNEKDSENIRQAIMRYEIEHPVVNDSDFSIWQGFGIRAWPSMVLINPDGRVHKKYSGEGHRQELHEDISNLIKKYKGRYEASALPISLEKNKAPKTILKFPGKLAYAEDFDGGPALFVSDSGNDRILGARLDGQIFLEIGSAVGGYKDGSFEEVQFDDPQGLLYRDKLLYVVETRNHTLRQIDLERGQVTTLAGTGKQGYDRTIFDADAKKTALASPWDIEFYPTDDKIVIAMAGTHQLWLYDIKNETVSVFAGNGRESIDDGGYPFNSLSQPSGLSVTNNKLYFVDSETSSLRVLEDGEIKTLIGTGLFDFGYAEGKRGNGLLQHPLGLYADDNNIYIADSYNHSIRQYDIKQKSLNNLSGNGKRGSGGGNLVSAQYSEPNDIIKIGDSFYIADTNNHMIRVLDIEGNLVENLNLIPQSLEFDFAIPQENLPNIIDAAQPKLAADKSVKLVLNLNKGWKINELAPSWLVLYELNDTGVNQVKHFNKSDLSKKTIDFPALEKDKKYRLQGTFYYCEDKEGALCLIKSYDQTFAPSIKGKEDVVAIELM